jgi:hypothetical protein
LSQVDFRKLAGDRKLHVSKLTLTDLTLHDYLDKRLPADTSRRPLMPGQMIGGIRFPVCIDTVALTNGFASYEEQTGDEPGRIFFDRMNATVTGFCTPSFPAAPRPDLDLRGTARLMGQAPMEAWFHFLAGHPRDTFAMQAAIGELELTAINPMLSKLMPVSILSGTASSTEILRMHANNTSAQGKLDFLHYGVAIDLHATQPGTWNQIESWLVSELANLFLAGGNPNRDGKMRSGIIYFERDQSKGFFNYVWKSALSGIKSSVGVNTKIQRERIKQDKKAKK